MVFARVLDQRERAYYAELTQVVLNPIFINFEKGGDSQLNLIFYLIFSRSSSLLFLNYRTDSDKNFFYER